jgi:hypothetical protein
MRRRDSKRKAPKRLSRRPDPQPGGRDARDLLGLQFERLVRDLATRFRVSHPGDPRTDREIRDGLAGVLASEGFIAVGPDGVYGPGELFAQPAGRDYPPDPEWPPGSVNPPGPMALHYNSAVIEMLTHYVGNQRTEFGLAIQVDPRVIPDHFEEFDRALVAAGLVRYIRPVLPGDLDGFRARNGPDHPFLATRYMVVIAVGPDRRMRYPTLIVKQHEAN